MKTKKKNPVWKKWWVWASVGVIILSIITGEGGNIGFRMNKDAALEEAEECLRYGAYSYEGLIEELNEYRGFAEDTAVFAADNCGADWNEQAAKKAKSYLEFTAFSRQGLIDQLKYEGFTDAQAAYGVKSVGY